MKKHTNFWLNFILVFILILIIIELVIVFTVPWNLYQTQVPRIVNNYEEFITQFEKFDSTALCGSTINYKDHPSRSERRDMPHVQTYALLTKAGFLKMIESAFPGADETERSKIILEGEIGLSQFYLNKDYGITCMEWTDRLITNNSKPISDTDIKEFVSADHQFYHRKYIANNKQRKIRNPLGRPLQIYIKHIFK